MKTTTPTPLFLLLLVSLTVLSGCSRARTDAPVQPVAAAVLLNEIRSGEAPLILDVRTPGEFAAGHVPGAINIPYEQMPARVAELLGHKDQPVVLYCRSGRRSGIASEVLAEHGFSDLRLLSGDMPGWERSGYPVER